MIVASAVNRPTCKVSLIIGSSGSSSNSSNLCYYCKTSGLGLSRGTARERCSPLLRSLAIETLEPSRVS